MAKKLNKKVAIIGIVLLALMILGGSGLLVYRHIRRDPDRALKLYHQALEAGDYLEAERQLGRSYAFGKTNEYKIDRLFELADFHLIQNDQHEAEWNKAMGCWNQVITIEPKNEEAHRALLDFFYQAADSGNPQAWRSVQEHTDELIDSAQSQGAEPDIFLLTAKAKALLSMARRGETTNRRELLNQSTEVLMQLLEKEPQNVEFYQLMAEAATVEGELNVLDGMINAEKNAREKASGLLEAAIEQSDDKATAVANLMLYKMQTMPSNDPNAIDALRAEIQQRRSEVTPNDKLWLITSIAYETPGQADAEAEINQAIEAIRRAHELDPDNFEYVLRLSRLMARKGNAFGDEAALADALQIAEDALSMDAVQDVPGPLQARNINYRFALNTYLSDIYLQKALAVVEEGNTETANDYIAKAQTRVDEIVNVLGTTENPMAQKYLGLIALAKGQRENGIRLLYETYIQSKALDQPGERSNVDALVCTVLAKEAERQNQIGLRAEFLQTALSSRERYVLQQPQLYLDYAEVLNELRNFRGWATIIDQFVLNFQRRYGANEKSNRLLIEAATGSGQYDKAQEYIDTLVGTPDDKLPFEFNLLVRQIGQLKQTIAALEAQNEPTDDQVQQLQTLRQKRNSNLTALLQTNTEEVNRSALATTCIDLIGNGQASEAVGYLDTYLVDHPDAINLLILRLQAKQDDPMNLTADQRSTLQLQAIESLPENKDKALLLAELYQQRQQFDKALAVFEENPQLDTQNDPDIIQVRFDIALEQNDMPAAEQLFQKIRTNNIDRCEGNLAGARLEIVKENYDQALRRLNQVLTLRPFFSYAHFLKSQVQNMLDQQEAAIESARTAVRMNPQSPVFTRNLASLLVARNLALGNKVTQEQRAEAESAILMASNLNPGDTQLQSVYAESIWEQAPDRAFSLRQQLLENNPTASNALMLGNMALRMARTEFDPAKKGGLIESAGEAYQKGLAIDPDNEMLLQAYADYQQATGKEIDPTEYFKGDRNMEWRFYLRNGQFAQAETLLNELQQENPDDPILVQGLITAAQALGKRDEIKQYLQHLSELDETKETELWILQKYIDNGFADEAEKNLASFKDRYPEDAMALLVEAWAKMGKGQLDEALTLTNRYLETDTNNAGAWRLRGRLYRLMNQPRKAIDDLQRSKNLQDDSQVRVELATVYSQLNQGTAAIGELVPSMEDPQTPLRVILMLESLYRQNNKTAELEKFYTSMIEKFPENPFWHQRSGAYYLGRKNYSMALDLLEKAMDLSLVNNQPSTSALDLYLEALSQNQQYDKAIEVGSRYIDGPLAYIAYSHIAEVQALTNQRQKAIESYYKALDKAGTQEVILQNVMQSMLKYVGQEPVTTWIERKLAADSTALPGHLLASRLAQLQGSYNKAIEQMDKCIEILGRDNPSYIGYAVNKVNLLIMGYTKTSDQQYLERAIELNSQLLELQPENASLLNNVAYLLADNNQQLETALEYSRKAHQSEPGNPIYLDTYAYAQGKTGRYEQSKENLVWAMQIYEAAGQPVPWDLYKHLAMAYEGLQDTDQAIEMYEKALDASEQISDSEKEQMQQAITQLRQS